MGPTRRDVPRDRRSSRRSIPTPRGSGSATSTWRRTCSEPGRSPTACRSRRSRRAIAARFGIEVTILPMTDRPVETRLDVVGGGTRAGPAFPGVLGPARRPRRREGDPIRGVSAATPAPGVLDAIASADAVVICPSNPVVSIGPILAVRGIREAVAARPVVGISPIVGGRPLAGMADRLMPVVGLEVSRGGRRGRLPGPPGRVGDRPSRRRPRGARARRDRRARRVTDTVMRDDEVAEQVARTALGALS